MSREWRKCPKCANGEWYTCVACSGIKHGHWVINGLYENKSGRTYKLRRIDISQDCDDHKRLMFQDVETRKRVFRYLSGRFLEFRTDPFDIIKKHELKKSENEENTTAKKMEDVR